MRDAKINSRDERPYSEPEYLFWLTVVVGATLTLALILVCVAPIFAPAS